MTITERPLASATVLDLSGGLTLADGVDLLRAQIRRLLQEGQSHIELNLAAVPDMDSAGLGELVGSYLAVTRQGGHLTLLNTPRHVRSMLAVTKLSAVFGLSESVSPAEIGKP